MIDELVLFKSRLDQGIGYLSGYLSEDCCMPKKTNTPPDPPLIVTRTDDRPKDNLASSKVSADCTMMTRGVARPTQVFAAILTL